MPRLSQDRNAPGTPPASNARWRQIAAIFHDALDLPPADRDPFVLLAAANDPSITAEVQELLRADAEAGSSFGEPFIPAELLAFGPILQPGDLLCGRFRIVRSLGEGGMGHVFEANDLDLGVHVALKILRPEIASSAEALARFRQEVRLARRLTHPNICRTFDLGRDTLPPDATGGLSRQLVFLTMEFLEGETLAARIQREGPIPLGEALAIARQVASALEAGRELGVVHRDVKPANIMLVPSPGGQLSKGPIRAVLTDFGLARALEADALSSSLAGLSRGANPIGTLAYMAPEQLRGQPIAPATDLYAFGLVLFEMATGRRAYPSDSLLDGVAQRLAGTLPALPATPKLPHRWRRAIEGCLRLDPAQRFPNANAAVAALEGRARLTWARPIWARRTWPRAAWPSRRRNPRQNLLLDAIFVAAILVAAVSLPAALWRYREWQANARVEHGAVVYLAPIHNGTGNKSLGGLTQLVEAGLSQSVQIKLLGEDDVEDMLRQMKRSPSAPIDPPTAREIALRAGAVRVVFLSVKPSPSGYRLDIDLQQPDANPHAYREHWTQTYTWPASPNSATLSPELLAAVRDATGWIRHEAGESRNDIARLDVPPGDLTTANWQALEEYASAERLIAAQQWEPAIDALRNAVRLDPSFASAYGRLGDLLDSMGREQEGHDAFRRALDAELETRLSRRERDRIRGMFALDTGDYLDAEAAFHDYANFYDREYDGWFYRARPLMKLDRLPEAIETLKRAYAINPRRASAPAHLAWYSMIAGDMPEAWKWQRVLVNQGFGDLANMVAGQLQMNEGRFDAAQRSFQAVAASSNPAQRAYGYLLLTSYYAERGDPRKALAMADEGIASGQKNGIAGLEAYQRIGRASLTCALGTTDGIAEDIHPATPLSASPESIAFASEALGHCAATLPNAKPLAVSLLRELLAGAKVEEDNVDSQVAHRRLQGELLLATGHEREAIAAFLKARQLQAPAGNDEYLGRAYLAAANRESNPTAKRELLTKALAIYRKLALEPARAWEDMIGRLPGFYADALQAYLKISAQLPDSSTNETPALQAAYTTLRGHKLSPQ